MLVLIVQYIDEFRRNPRLRRRKGSHGEDGEMPKGGVKEVGLEERNGGMQDTISYTTIQHTFWAYNAPQLFYDSC